VFAQIVADELGVPFEDVEVTTGDTRRMPYAVGTFASRAAVMSGNAIGSPPQRAEKALRIAGEALEADPGDLEIVDGQVRVKGAPGVGIAAGHGRGAVQPAALRLRRGLQGGDPVRVGDPGKPPVAEDDEPGLEGRDFYSPARSTFANGMHAVVVETDPETAEITILRYCVVHDCGNADQPDDRRGADPRRRRAGRRRRAVRADGLRRARPAAERLVHGLPHALRHRGARHDRDRPPRDAVAAQPARHQGRRRGRRHPGIRGAVASAIEDAEGFRITAMPISPSELFELRGASHPASTWAPTKGT
jgi:carbon-monoxide dehydrogenase large subunit